MSRSLPAPFRFKSTYSIGAVAAEDDTDFLNSCFVDTGALSPLEDVADRRLIVLGRTGAGKSALLARLEHRNPGRTIRISPEHLALTFVSNSTILTFFSNLGVNLDPFFKLLWRHVIAVELLTHRLNQSPDGQSLLDRLRDMFRGPTKHDRDMQQAIQYLEEYGDSFWQDTEYRVKEITQRFSTQLDSEARATLGPKAAGIGVASKGLERFSDEERSELVSRGQDIVSKAQIQDLSKLIRLVDSVLDDKHRKYYVILDGLDEGWVEDRLRYKLIMALIHTAREFHDVRHAKVIVALRRDLIERVFRLARDSGFQEEKFHSLYLPLVWTKDQLLEVLDRRIAHLVAHHYSGVPVSHRDVLPKQFRRKPIGDYLYSMAPRPRDMIAFFNACLASRADLPKYATSELQLAEGEYSRNRLRALADEWSGDHSDLLEFTRILNRRAASFKVDTIDDSAVADLCLTVAATSPSGTGLTHSALQVVDGPMSVAHFKLLLVRTFYQIGLVGLKLAPHERESWVDELGRSISFPEIGGQTSVVVHPAYRRTLGIRDDS